MKLYLVCMIKCRTICAEINDDDKSLPLLVHDLTYILLQSCMTILNKLPNNYI